MSEISIIANGCTESLAAIVVSVPADKAREARAMHAMAKNAQLLCAC